MSSRFRREELRRLRDAEERASELARVRHPHDGVSYAGAGMLRFRLLVVPSFARTSCWEIRQLGDELRLFLSRSPEPGQYVLVGEDELEIPSPELAGLLGGLRELTLPVSPNVEDFGVADGTTVEVVLTSGYTSRSHFTWSEGSEPLEWRPLAERVAAMLARFAELAKVAVGT